jgi:hypothetical protein
LQGGSGIVDLGGSEGEVGEGVGVGGGGGKGGGSGGGLLEEGLGGSGTMKAKEALCAVVEQGGVGVGGLRGDEGGVERFGLIGVVGIEVDAGQQAGDVGVGWVGGVEGFEERRGLGVLAGIVGAEVGAGEESGERGIGGMGGERGREEGFGIGGAMLGEKDVGQRGDGFGVLRVESEVAAIGTLGGGQIGGGFGDLGGEQDVFGSFGREVEGGEQIG